MIAWGIIAVASLALSAAAVAPVSAAFLESPAGQVYTMASRDGITVRYAAWAPEGPPRATILLFVGGAGVLGISSPPGSTWSNTGNFLTRSREWFRRRGLYVAAIDVPSDRAEGYKGFRVTAAHAADVAAVVADLRRRTPDAPLWLIGTSAGTMSAVNAAARLPGGTIDGIVLTSTITRGGEPDNVIGGTSVFNTDLASIRVPVLVAHHRADGCAASPHSGTERLRFQLARATYLSFEGGAPPISGPCDAQSPHGFLGIEVQVVNAIVDWIMSPKP